MGQGLHCLNLEHDTGRGVCNFNGSLRSGGLFYVCHVNSLRHREVVLKRPHAYIFCDNESYKLKNNDLYLVITDKGHLQNILKQWNKEYYVADVCKVLNLLSMFLVVCI